MPVIPNVFSPNGDGKHDTWRIEYLNKYPFCTVDVFDRNGQPVYHSYRYDSEWDGTYNGKPVPMGVYYYVIKPNSGREPITGSVTVIR
jgi:gliding motility-associated-like protein